MSLQECESSFLKNNLELLALQYNIDGQKAQIIQAKLWENPIVSTDLAAYSTGRGRIFDVGKNGQKALAVQQLIYLGKKKQYQVELAKKNAELAESEYKVLLRNLRFQLRVSFHNAYFDNLALQVITRQVQSLDTLITAYNVQSDKGNVPLRDVVRLQSLYIKLRNDRAELTNNIIGEQQTLAIITGLDSLIVPTPSVAESDIYTRNQQIFRDSILKLAIKNRPDLQYAEKSIVVAQAGLNWQKALAKPDIVVGLGYDQRGNAFANQFSVTASIPIVLWNRNQGNIQTAAAYVKQAQSQRDLQIIALQTEVNAVFQKYQEAIRNYQTTSSVMETNFEAVNKGVFQNFKKQNITILEFTDFVESYNESINEFNRIKKIRTNVYEEINYITGINLF
jgi:cobalt-zinc-cadmium efflux system outer membrane protein